MILLSYFILVLLHPGHPAAGDSCWGKLEQCGEVPFTDLWDFFWSLDSPAMVMGSKRPPDQHGLGQTLLISCLPVGPSNGIRKIRIFHPQIPNISEVQILSLTWRVPDELTIQGNPLQRKEPTYWLVTAFDIHWGSSCPSSDSFSYFLATMTFRISGGALRFIPRLGPLPM